MHFFVCSPNEFIRFVYKNTCVGFCRSLSVLPSTSSLQKSTLTPSNHIAVYNPQGAVGTFELLTPLQQCIMSTVTVLSKSLADNHSCLGFRLAMAILLLLYFYPLVCCSLSFWGLGVSWCPIIAEHPGVTFSYTVISSKVTLPTANGSFSDQSW